MPENTTGGCGVRWAKAREGAEQLVPRPAVERAHAAETVRLLANLGEEGVHSVRPARGAGGPLSENQDAAQG
jgi:hypothetical protein